MNKSYNYQSEAEIINLAEQERARVIGQFFKNIFNKKNLSYTKLQSRFVMGGYKTSKN